jgi:hypothetical protein
VVRVKIYKIQQNLASPGFTALLLHTHWMGHITIVFKPQVTFLIIVLDFVRLFSIFSLSFEFASFPKGNI